MAIDWKALLVGVGVSFSPVMIFAQLSTWVGELPTAPILDRVAVGPGWLVLFFATGPLLGALAAGYLHSPRVVGGAVYGVGVAAIGYFLPSAIVVVLLVGIGGVGWVVGRGRWSRVLRTRRRVDTRDPVRSRRRARDRRWRPG